MREHNMVNRIIILTFLILLFTQCNFEIKGDIQYIYKLTSPDKQIEIYECFIESPMAFGSGNIETTILTLGEKYNPRHSGNFSGYRILGWIGNDTLKVIKFHKKKENETKIPDSKLHEIKKWRNLYLDITHRTSYGGGKAWFSFDSLYFKSDSVYFLQKDSLGLIKDKLGLLKGQIRLSLDSDTISMIYGEYHVRIEDHFAKITEANEFGYPYVVGEYCEITPRYRLESSIFKEQPITVEIDIKDYK
jgi:hypothetical protein